MQTPYPVGDIHFIGIGGIGMSGIAEVLVAQGFQVSGSDVKASSNTERLEGLGCTITIGHNAENLAEAQVVVVSSAVAPDNVELLEARKKHLPIVRRAEMLAELMRLKWSITVAGSHGKTTTTSLIGHLLDACDFDPTVINGGIINAYNTNIRLGEGPWFVAEADESDGSFLTLPATIAVVTNLDPEHMEHYGSIENLREAFLNFVKKVPFYGFAVMCLEDRQVRTMVAELQDRRQDRRIITYGFSPEAMVRSVNLQTTNAGMQFDVEIGDEKINDVRLNILGEHNVLNALAAIAVAWELNIDGSAIKKSFLSFGGVKRRFTQTGEVGGVRIIDDYAHHPTEIAATLKGARQALGKGEGEGRIMAVVQPHRYSRLADLFDDFCSCMKDADYVLISEVYAAGEAAIDGINGEALVKGLQAAGHNQVEFLLPEALPQKVGEWGKSGDMVICMGAGTVTTWAHELPAALEKLRGKA